MAGSSTAADTRIAALVDDGSASANGLLAELAATLQQQGWIVRGVLRDDVLADEKALPCRMRLTDIHNGARFTISQALGAQSAACSVDEQGIAAASMVLQHALRDIQAQRECGSNGPFLVVVNRFGKLEAAGAGFASELLALMAAEIPLVVVVGRDVEERWHEFTAGMAQTLPLQAQALRNWCLRLPAHENTGR